MIQPRAWPCHRASDPKDEVANRADWAETGASPGGTGGGSPPRRSTTDWRDGGTVILPPSHGSPVASGTESGKVGGRVRGRQGLRVRGRQGLRVRVSEGGRDARSRGE